MFALGDKTVTCLPRKKGKIRIKGSLSRLTAVPFASELRSSVPPK